MNRSIDRKQRVSPKRTSEKVRHLTEGDLLSLEQEPPTQRLPLQSLAVEGLLSFGERSVFEFGRLNLLVGPNGSGKSNLIDCVRLLRYSPYDIQETFGDSGFDDWLYRGPSRQSSALIEVTATVPTIRHSIRQQLRLGPPVKYRAQVEELIDDGEHGDRESVQYFVGSYRSSATLSFSSSGKRRQTRKLTTREYDPFQSIVSQIRDSHQYPEISGLANLYSSFRIYSEWTFGRRSDLRKATPPGLSDPRLSELMDNLALALDNLKESAAHDRIRILLTELKESYRDFLTRHGLGGVVLELVENTIERPLDAHRLSDGTLRFLALAAVLLQTDPPPVVCLEEPELGMHPDMIRIVANMIVEGASRMQLIVSTHSEELLSALQDAFDVLFAFDAGPVGSVIRRLTRSEYEEWRGDHSLGELWASGEVGGVRY